MLNSEKPTLQTQISSWWGAMLDLLRSCFSSVYHENKAVSCWIHCEPALQTQIPGCWGAVLDLLRSHSFDVVHFACHLTHDAMGTARRQQTVVHDASLDVVLGADFGPHDDGSSRHTAGNAGWFSHVPCYPHPQNDWTQRADQTWAKIVKTAKSSRAPHPLVSRHSHGLGLWGDSWVSHCCGMGWLTGVYVEKASP